MGQRVEFFPNFVAFNHLIFSNMAKGIGLIGNMSGKLGNTVAYRLKNSNNRETQGFRVYQPNVTNPQTDQQLDQRVKMAVVTNEYRALRDVIRRGQQSFPYGDASRRAWLSMALGADFVGPYLDKGDKSPLPMPNVPISVGGLPEVVCDYVDEDGNARTSLILQSAFANDTIGVVTSHLIVDNTWLSEGDQITFVMCCLAEATSGSPSSSYYYRVVSFVLDLSSSVALSTYNLSVDRDSELNSFTFTDDAAAVVAAAVIISREGSAGEHLRSTARFGFADILTNYYASLNPAQARRSYKKGVTAESDWPTEPAAGVGTTPVDALLLSGLEVPVTDLAVVSGYMKASGYFLKITDVHNAKYNRYITGLSSSSSTAPDGSTNDNTISVDPSATTAQQMAFTQWLLNNGVNAQWLFTGSN